MKWREMFFSAPLSYTAWQPGGRRDDDRIGISGLEQSRVRAVLPAT